MQQKAQKITPWCIFIFQKLINSLSTYLFTDVKTSLITNMQEFEPQINPFNYIH